MQAALQLLAVLLSPIHLTQVWAKRTASVYAKEISAIELSATTGHSRSRDDVKTEAREFKNTAEEQGEIQSCENSEHLSLMKHVAFAHLLDVANCSIADKGFHWTVYNIPGAEEYAAGMLFAVSVENRCDPRKLEFQHKLSKKHARIAAIYAEAGWSAGCVSLMENLQGGTLEDLMVTVTKRSESESLIDLFTDISLQVIAGVQDIRAEGWYHQAVKPANIMLKYPIDMESLGAKPSPQVKFINFDFAASKLGSWQNGYKMNGYKIKLGSNGYPENSGPEYMPLWSGQAVSDQDMYGAGAVLLDLWSGKKHLLHSSLKEYFGYAPAFGKPENRLDEVNSQVEKLLASCCHGIPEQISIAIKCLIEGRMCVDMPLAYRNAPAPKWPAAFDALPFFSRIDDFGADAQTQLQKARDENRAGRLRDLTGYRKELDKFGQLVRFVCLIAGEGNELAPRMFLHAPPLPHDIKHPQEIQYIITELSRSAVAHDLPENMMHWDQETEFIRSFESHRMVWKRKGERFAAVVVKDAEFRTLQDVRKETEQLLDQILNSKGDLSNEKLSDVFRRYTLRKELSNIWQVCSRAFYPVRPLAKAVPSSWLAIIRRDEDQDFFRIHPKTSANKTNLSNIMKLALPALDSSETYYIDDQSEYCTVKAMRKGERAVAILLAGGSNPEHPLSKDLDAKSNKILQVLLRNDIPSGLGAEYFREVADQKKPGSQPDLHSRARWHTPNGVMISCLMVVASLISCMVFENQF